MAAATIRVKIESDGKLRITIDGAIPQQFHDNADELLKFVEQKQGCEKVTEQLAGYVHEHGHTHEHIHTS